MESVFIQKIFLLTEEILANKRDLAEIYKELETHLTRARRLKFGLYEAETLNTVAIYHFFNNQIEIALDTFQMAWAIAQKLDNIDIKIKLAGNLGETYMRLWRLDEALQMLVPIVELIRKEKLETLMAFQAVENLVWVDTIRGEYTTADELIDEAWKMASQIEMRGYSRTEYAQMIIVLHQQKILIDIAKSKFEAAKERLSLLRGLLNTYNRQDFEDDYTSILAIYKLFSEINSASLDTFEKSLESGEVVLDASRMLNMAMFMEKNHKPDWAKRMARRALDKVKDEKKPPPKLIEIANHIVNA